MTKETFAFQAEINQLMSLIINTFYSNKDIFLRELISNSSDALDKIRYQSITNASALNDNPNMKIKIIPDMKNKTLTISDDGIGMNKEDLVNNLGTIARSGTKNFMEALKEGSDVNMIGQFGVGFYSAYLVAEKVTVRTKNNDGKAYVWESTAGGSFSIEEYDGEMNRGTQMICHLKDDMHDYLNESRLRELVKKHSEFINYPIELYTERTEEEEVTDDEDDDDDENDKPKIDDVEEGEEDKKKKTKKVTKTVNEFKELNTVKPIWTRPESEISSEDYTSFYKSLSNDFEEPLSHKHFSVEGQIEFKALLFCPKRAPFDLFNKKEHNNNIKLYVRRVFITDDCKEFFPDYLSFITGIVDSEDLPLNISREMLQQNKVMKVVKKNLVKKVFEMFEKLADDKEKYKIFYQQFSKNLKLGIHEDEHNRKRLLDLLRYQTNKSGQDLTSLEDYVTRMKEGQKGIYYMTGETLNDVADSPFVEKLNKEGYEVIFMTDSIDEYCTQQMTEYDGHKMLNCAKEGLEIDDNDEEKFKKTEEEFKLLTDKVKEVLGPKVEKVCLSKRLETSPCALVTSQYGWSANMERIMKAQALQDANMAQHMMGKKTLELNPEHRIVNALKKRAENKNDEKSFGSLVNLLFETSMLMSGYTPTNTKMYGSSIHRMIELGLNLGADTDEDEDEDVIDELENIKASNVKSHDIDSEDMEDVD